MISVASGSEFFGSVSSGVVSTISSLDFSGSVVVSVASVGSGVLVGIGVSVGTGVEVGSGVGVSVGNGEGVSVTVGVGVSVGSGVGVSVGSAVVDSPDVSSEEVASVEVAGEDGCEAEVSLEESLQETKKREQLSSKDRTSSKARCRVFLIDASPKEMFVHICIVCLYLYFGNSKCMRGHTRIMGISSRGRIPVKRGTEKQTSAFQYLKSTTNIIAR